MRINYFQSGFLIFPLLLSLKLFAMNGVENPHNFKSSYGKRLLFESSDGIKTYEITQGDFRGETHRFRNGSQLPESGSDSFGEFNVSFDNGVWRQYTSGPLEGQTRIYRGEETRPSEGADNNGHFSIRYEANGTIVHHYTFGLLSGHDRYFRQGEVLPFSGHIDLFSRTNHLSQSASSEAHGVNRYSNTDVKVRPVQMAQSQGESSYSIVHHPRSLSLLRAQQISNQNTTPQRRYHEVKTAAQTMGEQGGETLPSSITNEFGSFTIVFSNDLTRHFLTYTSGDRKGQTWTCQRNSRNVNDLCGRLLRVEGQDNEGRFAINYNYENNTFTEVFLSGRFQGQTRTYHIGEIYPFRGSDLHGDFTVEPLNSNEWLERHTNGYIQDGFIINHYKRSDNHRPFRFDYRRTAFNYLPSNRYGFELFRDFSNRISDIESSVLSTYRNGEAFPYSISFRNGDSSVPMYRGERRFLRPDHNSLFPEGPITTFSDDNLNIDTAIITNLDSNHPHHRTLNIFRENDNSLPNLGSDLFGTFQITYEYSITHQYSYRQHNYLSGAYQGQTRHYHQEIDSFEDPKPFKGTDMYGEFNIDYFTSNDIQFMRYTYTSGEFTGETRIFNLSNLFDPFNLSYSGKDKFGEFTAEETDSGKFITRRYTSGSLVGETLTYRRGELRPFRGSEERGAFEITYNDDDDTRTRTYTSGPFEGRTLTYRRGESRPFVGVMNMEPLK